MCNFHIPDNLNFSCTFRLFLFPLWVIPVQFIEQNYQSRDQVQMFIHPAGFQDAFGDVPFIRCSLDRNSQHKPVWDHSKQTNVWYFVEIIYYLGATFGVLVVSWEHFERDGDSVSTTVCTEGVPNSPVHSVVHNIQASQGYKSHRPTT